MNKNNEIDEEKKRKKRPEQTRKKKKFNKWQNTKNNQFNNEKKNFFHSHVNFQLIRPKKALKKRKQSMANANPKKMSSNLSTQIKPKQWNFVPFV